MTKHYSKKNQQTFPELLIMGVFRLVWGLVKLIFQGFKPKARLTVADRNYMVSKRLEIETMANSNNIHELRQAVFEADKLVDFALKKQGFAGNNMGERLRSAASSVERGLYHNLWQGHKLRNELAHESVSHGQGELREAVQRLLRYISSV
ncbi:MAG: hypothetical protein BWY68_00600 [bacterium ADurb.Bin400]|nr:MAG: hypothetical protein BWY68_00600 [bacterium ADurb.Bin400]